MEDGIGYGSDVAVRLTSFEARRALEILADRNAARIADGRCHRISAPKPSSSPPLHRGYTTGKQSAA
jgi:hypothetical protein